MPYVNHETLEMERGGHTYRFCLRGMRDAREEIAAYVFGEGETREMKLVSAGNLTVYVDGKLASMGSGAAVEPFVLLRYRARLNSPTRFRIEGVRPAFEFPPEAREDAERYEAWRKACFETWETPEAKKLMRNTESGIRN